MTYTYRYNSPLGPIAAASNGTEITGLWLDEQKYFGSTLQKECKEKMLTVFDEVKKWLDVYFSGKSPNFTPPVKLSSTDFRQAVWEIIRTIPFGQTMTYGEIAAQIAKQQGLPKISAQAIGNAVGRNPISLIIPCHRVIGANGNLTGYAGGLDRKAKLLAMEKSNSPLIF